MKKKSTPKPKKSDTKLYPSRNPSVAFRKYQAQAYYEGWSNQY
jgi:hypothetical protein